MPSTSKPRFTRGILSRQFAQPFFGRGGLIEPVLRSNGIPLTALADPKYLLEASAFYAALEEMAATLNDPHFAATVARNAAFKGVPSLRVSEQCRHSG